MEGVATLILFFWGTILQKKKKNYMKNFNIKNKDNKISQRSGNSFTYAVAGLFSPLFGVPVERSVGPLICIFWQLYFCILFVFSDNSTVTGLFSPLFGVPVERSVGPLVGGARLEHRPLDGGVGAPSGGHGRGGGRTQLGLWGKMTLNNKTRPFIYYNISTKSNS